MLSLASHPEVIDVSVIFPPSPMDTGPHTAIPDSGWMTLFSCFFFSFFDSFCWFSQIFQPPHSPLSYHASKFHRLQTIFLFRWFYRDCNVMVHWKWAFLVDFWAVLNVTKLCSIIVSYFFKSFGWFEFQSKTMEL